MYIFLLYSAWSAQSTKRVTEINKATLGRCLVWPTMEPRLGEQGCESCTWKRVIDAGAVHELSEFAFFAHPSCFAFLKLQIAVPLCLSRVHCQRWVEYTRFYGIIGCWHCQYHASSKKGEYRHAAPILRPLPASAAIYGSNRTFQGVQLCNHAFYSVQP